MYALVDIDGTTADLMSAWLNIYNVEWHDLLTSDQIIDWDTSLFVKPECGTKIYKIIENPEIYDYVLPINQAKEGLQSLRDLGFEIVHTTTIANGTAGAKYNWLNKYGLWDEKDHYIETKSKFLIKGDLMIDDGPHNFDRFDGYKILFDQPWNRKIEFKNRMLGWSNIIGVINKYKTWKTSQVIPV